MKPTKVELTQSDVNTSAQIIRAYLSAAIAESRRDTIIAMSLLQQTKDELVNLASLIADNPAKG